MGWHTYPGAFTVWRVTVLVIELVCTALGKRHVVYWNSTNTKLVSGDYSIQVDLNDYLDILCPHYPADLPSSSSPPETLALYLVPEAGFRGCHETRGAIKRWECNSPYAPYGAVRFSEKIQRFTPFSLGFEFLPGHHYYYSSLSTDDGPPLPCMKIRVTVCCESTGPEREQGTPAPRSRVDPVTSGSRRPPPLLLFPLVLVLLSV
ncbi:ephrin-A4 isoform X2 [Clupea harengus]|uniref:Ephrin-A4 n=1 Tax=Clupea harengus TaxID=7950 RepID=A0A6P8G924_CLUHA|nr:ephrin-A4 isoform X2 [Clupea harengus]